MTAPTDLPAWHSLGAAQAALENVHLRELFEAQPERATNYRCQTSGLLLDYSKNRLDDQVLALFGELADQVGLAERIQALFAGHTLNSTERRAALHSALRLPEGSQPFADHPELLDQVTAMRRRCYAFAQSVRNGQWHGFSGEAITDVVNIGIGGSDLGPRLVCAALADPTQSPRVHFVANVDRAELDALLADLKPQNTLFVVTSKTFGTEETLANAQAARQWLVAAADETAIARHFVAVSTNADAVQAFGIDLANMFGFWDWVGGRYSLWSSVGLSIMLALGTEAFDDLLAGAHAMDQHFKSSPWTDNMPVLMAMLGVWYNNFFGCATQSVLSYSHRLGLLSDYLQQLQMESNGKRVRRYGDPVDYPTSPVVWGGAGTVSQHSVFQLLHQGTELVPVDFILVAKPLSELETDSHQRLLANCLAQAQALMMGRTTAEVWSLLEAEGLGEKAQVKLLPHREFPGNGPSNLLLLDELKPFNLGALLALYEHKTFVQSVIWDVNAFDQWGVELGKSMASDLLACLRDGAKPAENTDPSTLALLDYLKQV